MNAIPPSRGCRDGRLAAQLAAVLVPPFAKGGGEGGFAERDGVVPFRRFQIPLIPPLLKGEAKRGCLPARDFTGAFEVFTQ